jgi:cell wall-associated NlpC family hydrolase
LNAADKEFADAQKAAGKVTPFALDPLAPALDSKGQPISPKAGGSGVLGEAKSWLGVPYDYSHSAGQTRRAVDCSAFTAAVYKKFGISLPDSPAGQMGMGTPVSGSPRAGDLVFWSEDSSGVPTHVGIANGDGTTTHSSSFTGEVSVTPMKYIKGYLGARRLM